MFIKNTNLLIIDKEHWERLDWIERHKVLRTEAPCLEIHYPPNKPPVVTSRSK